MKKNPAKSRNILTCIHACLQTLLLCYLIFRVEGLSHKLTVLSNQLHEVSNLFKNITQTVLEQLEGARLQFAASIDSILSIFGSDNGS